ncbi:TetR/AcrR family transcriptional regulator [Aldersonia kunmingensis]|uniref:TetR/AcrR family transcriptional regulator n=1 Tax=Aldersonia kunmingensis TaxID=408066 RepID=UPI00082CCD6D|nr:TetR/AcrR family transcriptional regulator [Aldersonia kunmingensis]
MTTAVTTARGARARERLIAAATEELAQTGTFEVAAVARRAGVSAGLPYRYFGTRTGLLLAVVDSFYQRFCDTIALRVYDEPTWAARERRRIADWVGFIYTEPAAPVILAGLGEGELATARGRWLREMSGIGAGNIAQGQRAGEIPADRDPEYLAAATIGGTNAVIAISLTRSPRPPASEVIDQLWSFVSGAVGLTTSREGRIQ